MTSFFRPQSSVDYWVPKFKAAISNDLFYLGSTNCFFNDFWVFRGDRPLAGEIDEEWAALNRNRLVIKEKITNVLLKLLSVTPDVLVQFWSPLTTTEGKCFLSTSDQPFGISEYHGGLCAFRKLYMNYGYYVIMDTTDEKDYFGLIRRAFLQKSPTLHLNLKCCSNKDYPQLDQLVQCKIKGFATLPVLEPSSMGCVGVLEILTTAEDIGRALNCYTSLIRRQLEDVDLKLSDDYNICLNPEVASNQDPSSSNPPTDQDPSSSNPPTDQDPSSSNPPTDQAIQDGRIATIKAEYGDDIIKFKLSFSSRMRDLEEEVGKRLKLENGTFKIKYVDGDGDRILIACEADLKDCIHFLTSSSITTIKMFVELGALS